MEEKTLKQLLEIVAKFVIDTTPEEFKIEEVAERLKTTFYSSIPSYSSSSGSSSS